MTRFFASRLQTRTKSIREENGVCFIFRPASRNNPFLSRAKSTRSRVQSHWIPNQDRSRRTAYRVRISLVTICHHDPHALIKAHPQAPSCHQHQ
jgi:hypothetical protein